MISLTACKWYDNSDVSETTENSASLGRVVTEIDPSIRVIYQDASSNFWFGSKENGLFQFDGNQIKHFDHEDGLISNQVRGIQEDVFGNIYFETEVGISQFDGKSFNTLAITESSSNTQNWKLDPNDLWFSSGYQKNGPYRYDGKALYHYEFPKSPREEDFKMKYPKASHSPYGIYSIFKDSQGNVWFGTSDLGIYRFDGISIAYLYEEQLTVTPGGGAFGIRSIAEDKKGLFWICNSNYKYKILPDSISDLNPGLINYERLPGIRGKEKETQYYLSIIPDDNNNLWMLTYNNGVWKNNGKELIHYQVTEGTKQVKLLSIFKDNQGIVWLGSQGSGIYRFNGRSFEKYNF